MKKIFPAFIIFLTVVFFWQFFLHGLLSIPSDTLVGLYHPFRDLFAGNFPRGIPFKNFLITDPIRQQYPWRLLVISLEKQLQIPLWNPYSFAGYPLMANFQSGSFYPLNILFFFLPFSLAWTILIMLQPILGGILLYFYLKNLKLRLVAAFLGAIVFAFSGFSIAWLEWGTIVQTMTWIPLILLSIDKIDMYIHQKEILNKIWRIQRYKIWACILLLGMILSFFAGHLQIFFYVFIVSTIYMVVKILQSKQKRKLITLFTLCYALFIVITAIQLIPTIQFILLSARSFDQNYLTTAGWFIPYQNLLQFFIPDFFGNPTTLNYWGVWNYGELVGYVGLLPLLFAVFSVVVRRDNKTYFWGTLCLCTFIFSLPTPFAKIPYILHVPLISTSQPTRLLAIIDLCLAILAALGFDLFLHEEKYQKLLLWIIGIFFFVFFGTWLFLSQSYITILSQSNIAVAKHNTIFPIAIFAAISFILFLFIFFQKYIPQKARSIVISILIFITIVDLLRFGQKFNPFTPQAYLYPPTDSLVFLQKNAGIQRIMTTDDRILPPNVSDMYQLQSVDGYDPLYIQNYAEFISAMQRNRPYISPPFGFNRMISPHDYTSPFINLLGVKYILTFDTLSSGYKKVFQEGQTNVYENKNVFPRAFFVRSIIPAISKQDAIDKMFVYQLSLKTNAVVESIQSVPGVGVGNAQIFSYQANSILIKTNNNSVGFLVLTDIFYPTWHAYIDGKETKIYPTDFAFRGIIVPARSHTVEFRDQLF